MTEVLRLDPKSARGDAIRALAGMWRSSVTVDEHGVAKPNVEKAEFLLTYDIEYLQRAIRYLRTRIRRAALGRLPKGHEGAKEFVESDRMAVTQAQKMLTQLAEAPIHNLFVEAVLTEGDAQRRADLQFIVDPETAADRRKDSEGITDAMLGATESAYGARVRFILAHERWKREIQFAHDELSKHFRLGPISKDRKRSGGLDDVRNLLTPMITERYGGWGVSMCRTRSCFR